jgi:hypothetical protein
MGQNAALAGEIESSVLLTYWHTDCSLDCPKNRGLVMLGQEIGANTPRVLPIFQGTEH